MAAAAARTLFCTSHHKLFFFFPVSNCSILAPSTLNLLKKSHNKNLVYFPIRCFQSQFAHQTTSSILHSQSHEAICHPNVIDILEERGLLESLTNQNLRSITGTDTLKVYCGFDPTAESLHLGNLLGILVLSWFQRCGHKAVALIGGATARIGDPSGKNLERPDADTLEKNTQDITNTITRILNLNGNNNNKKDPMNPTSCFVVMNNYDWWKEVRFLDFLKQVGRYARVGTMMSKESVKKRLESEQGMSYTEFTYQLLQGYDFFYLYQNEGVNVQIGGSDQWGNIIAGTELIRKILQPKGDVAYGLTFPLLLKSDGNKFGKSEDGAIWLSPSMLSPYKFYQYFFSVPDNDVIRFLKMLTFLDMEKIDELEGEMKRPGYVPNTAQPRLAEQVTLFVHGEDGLDEALKVTVALRPGADTTLDWKTIEGIAEDVSFSLAYDQGRLYLNNRRIDSEKKIEPQDIVDGKVLLLFAGKKNKVIVRIS